MNRDRYKFLLVFVYLCSSVVPALCADSSLLVRQIEGRWWSLSAKGEPVRALPEETGALVLKPFDVFDAEAAKLLCGQVRTQPARLRVIPAPTRAWVDALRRLGPDQAGKHYYINSLKDRYGYVVGELNRAFGTDFTSFTDLLAEDFRRLDLTREAVREHDAAILREIGNALAAIAGPGEAKECGREVLVEAR
jgi:hypothetical protein